MSDDGDAEDFEILLPEEHEFQEAARSGNISAVKTFIRNRINVNCADEKDRTALHLAAGQGHAEVVETLVDADAKIDFADKYGMSGILWAAWFGHKESLASLIKCGANIKAENKIGQTIAHCAAARNHVDVLKYIVIEILEDEEDDEDEEAEEPDGDLPSMEGLTKSVWNGVTGMPSNALGTVWGGMTGGVSKMSDGVSKMSDGVSIVTGGVSKMTEGMTGGVSKITGGMSKLTGGVTAMPGAALGSVWGGMTDGMSKMTGAISSVANKVTGSSERLDKMRGESSFMEKTTCKQLDSKTPLLVACENGHLPAVEYLVQARCNKQARTTIGSTGLHLAAANGHVDVIKKLLDCDLEIDVRNMEGKTPLHMAAESGHPDAVELLLQRKANGNIKSSTAVVEGTMSLDGNSFDISPLTDFGNSSIPSTASFASSAVSMEFSDDEDAVVIQSQSQPSRNQAFSSSQPPLKQAVNYSQPGSQPPLKKQKSAKIISTGTMIPPMASFASSSFSMEFSDDEDAVVIQSQSQPSRNQAFSSSQPGSQPPLMQAFSSSQPGSQPFRNQAFSSSQPGSQPPLMQAFSSSQPGSQPSRNQAVSSSQPGSQPPLKQAVNSSQLGSQPPLKKQKNTKFDVKAILSKTKAGRKAIKFVQETHSLDYTNRKTVCHMCTQHLVDIYGSKPSADIKEAMAGSIVMAFPALKDPEGKGYEQWYVKGCTKSPAQGALECHLKNLRRQKDDDEASEKKQLHDEKEKEKELQAADKYDPEQMKTLTETLKHTDKDTTKTKELMKETALYRRDYIHLAGDDESRPSLSQIQERFPHLMDDGMIEQDYEMIFSKDMSNRMFQKWPVMSACVLSYANSVVKDWPKRLGLNNVDAEHMNSDERMNLAFFVLPILFEGRKSIKGGRASNRETSDCFIDLQKRTFGAIHFAAKNNHTTVIRMLAKYKVDFNLRCENQNAAIHIASALGNCEAIDAILDGGGNVNAMNEKRRTSLHEAVENGFNEAVEKLLIGGIYVPQIDKSGKTALMMAARAENITCVDMIIKADRFLTRKKQLGQPYKRGSEKIQFRKERTAAQKQMQSVCWDLAMKHLTNDDMQKLIFVWSFTQPQVNAIQCQFTGKKSWREHTYRMMLIWLHGIENNPLKEMYESLVAIGKKKLAEQVRFKMSHNGNGKGCLIS